MKVGLRYVWSWIQQDVFCFMLKWTNVLKKTKINVNINCSNTKGGWIEGWTENRLDGKIVDFWVQIVRKWRLGYDKYSSIICLFH